MKGSPGIKCNVLLDGGYYSRDRYNVRVKVLNSEQEKK